MRVFFLFAGELLFAFRVFARGISPYTIGMKRVDRNLLDVIRIMEKKYPKREVALLFKDYPEDTSYAGFEEPLPDFIGYKQHSTECASDALQEILLFADDIREYTQPILYNLTRDQIAIHSKLTLKYTLWDRLTDYFFYVQKRFRGHYDVLNYMRTHKIKPQAYVSDYDKVCELDPLFRKKRIVSAEGGILALKKLKGEKDYSDTGMSRKIIFETIQKVLQWLEVPFQVVRQAEIDLDKAVGIHLILTTGYFKPDGSVYWRTTGHATAFLKIKGRWHFYDNEDGIHAVGKELIEDYKDPTKHVVIYITTKQYFVKGFPNPTHVWRDDHWSTDLRGVATRAADGLYVAKPNTVILSPNPFEMRGIVPTELKYNKKQCTFNTEAVTAETAVKTMEKLIECVYANPDSNSSIFEDIYHFMADHLDLLKTDHELFANLISTLPTIGKRPATTPIIHYWVYKIQSALRNHVKDNYDWFELPVLKNIVLPPGQPTPPEVRIKKQEAILEQEKRERELANGIDPDKKEVPKERKKPERKTKKSTPEKKEKKEKLSPCLPGQVRNAKTKKCRARLARLTPCPPGQIRDKKTRKCRPLEKHKLVDA